MNTTDFAMIIFALVICIIALLAYVIFKEEEARDLRNRIYALENEQCITKDEVIEYFEKLRKEIVKVESDNSAMVYKDTQIIARSMYQSGKSTEEIARVIGAPVTIVLSMLR